MGAGLAPEADPSRQFHGEAQPQPSKSVLAADMPKADKMSRDPLQATNLVRMERQVTSENSNAQYELGVGSPDGKDVAQTYAAAMAQFEETAKKGNADAGWKLGLGYLKGIGVGKDETRAAEWFKKAANLGDVRAQTALSDLYFTGVGVRRDYVRAYTWASIAASGWGNEDERLKDIGQRMTTAQLENANRRTAAWFAQKTHR
jgi:TPR repeat protein